MANGLVTVTGILILTALLIWWGYDTAAPAAHPTAQPHQPEAETTPGNADHPAGRTAESRPPAPERAALARQPAARRASPPPAAETADAAAPQYARMPWQEEDARRVAREIAAAPPRNLDEFRTVTEPTFLDQHLPDFRDGKPQQDFFEDWYPGKPPE